MALTHMFASGNYNHVLPQELLTRVMEAKEKTRVKKESDKVSISGNIPKSIFGGAWAVGCYAMFVLRCHALALLAS